MCNIKELFEPVEDHASFRIFYLYELDVVSNMFSIVFYHLVLSVQNTCV